MKIKLIKHGLFIAVITLVALTHVACSSTHESPENLAKGFIDALKKDTADSLRTLIINLDDIQELKAMMKDEKLDVNELKAKIDKDVPEIFTKIKDKASKAGLDWNKVKIVNIEKENKIKREVNYTRVNITVESDNTQYLLVLKSTIKTKRGWVISDKPRWRGKKNN